jgi:hypothetical protein
MTIHRGIENAISVRRWSNGWKFRMISGFFRLELAPPKRVCLGVYDESRT